MDRVGALLAHRANTFLVVDISRSRGASRYIVSASLSDGRELGFDLEPGCRKLLIAGVPAGVAAKVMIAGMRYGMATGAKRSISIKSNAASAGPKSKLPRRLWRPVMACRRRWAAEPSGADEGRATRNVPRPRRERSVRTEEFRPRRGHLRGRSGPPLCPSG
jgi:hypothetical protein